MLNPSSTIGPRLTNNTSKATNPPTNNKNFLMLPASFLYLDLSLPRIYDLDNEPQLYFELGLEAYLGIGLAFL
ncbi:hypothetical protein GCM10008025_15110 [Ornithinibacillus halotolerans]|uniref:Uncharacterized protein n=1 Tax=Ornithinibacillus halotolerans TaxID=1274357 RepID=A0A916RWA6_9BACI|nr:hypothetical protein GCM10008025_15110 [Ornithinibacillus halotolerans]